MSSLDIQTQNLKNVSPIQNILSKMIKAQEKGDINAFASAFAHDPNMVNIGTDLDEMWYNWSSFYKWMSEAIKKKKGLTITEKDTHITLSKGGDIAWYSQLLDTCLETKGEPFNPEGFRHTGVMEKRGSDWVIVQSHISAPYKDNDQLNPLI